MDSREHRPSKNGAITPSELRRQLVHAGFGLIALCLRWLSWPLAAGVAALAVVNNLFLLRRLPGGERLFRPGEARFGGIVLYPLVVLALILALPLELAAAAWVILAIGDAVSNLCGRAIGGPRLPWNRAKSWAGTLAFALLSLPCAALALGFVAAGHGAAPGAREAWIPAAAGALCGALAESLPLRLDDNLSVALAAGVALQLAAWAL